MHEIETDFMNSYVREIIIDYLCRKELNEKGYVQIKMTKRELECIKFCLEKRIEELEKEHGKEIGEA